MSVEWLRAQMQGAESIRNSDHGKVERDDHQLLAFGPADLPATFWCSPYCGASFPTMPARSRHRESCVLFDRYSGEMVANLPPGQSEWADWGLGR